MREARREIKNIFHLSFSISTVPTLVEQNQLFAKMVQVGLIVC